MCRLNVHTRVYILYTRRLFFYTNPGYGWTEAKGASRMCKGGALAVRRVWKASLLPELPSEPGPVLVFLCVYVFVEQIRSSVSTYWGLLNIKKSRGTTHTDIHTHKHRALIYTRTYISHPRTSHTHIQPRMHAWAHSLPRRRSFSGLEFLLCAWI